jgi:hypothetical protein
MAAIAAAFIDGDGDKAPREQDGDKQHQEHPDDGHTLTS